MRPFCTSSSRGLRGGSFFDISNALFASHRREHYPSYEDTYLGFRVASVPEPGSITLVFVGIACLLAYGWRRRRKLHNMSLMILAAAMVLATGMAQAVNIDLVTVGNPVNAGEWSGESYGGWGPDRICGSVGYEYQIGKYEVTAAQYTEFLNHKATVTDTYGLYNTYMADPTNYWGCNIQRTGSEGSYRYSVASDWANRPVNYVSFWDAARFANWMNNGQGNGDTETGAYTLNGYNGSDGRSITRNPGAKWFLPSEDEWYKAAYHKNDGVTGNYWDYPTKSDAPPINTLLTTDPGNHANIYDYFGTGNNSYTIGSPYYRTEVGDFENSASAYGTFDQGGNVWEWNEAVVYESEDSSSRGLRGGSFVNGSTYLLASGRYYGGYPSEEGDDGMGFRVASIPNL